MNRVSPLPGQEVEWISPPPTQDLERDPSENGDKLVWESPSHVGSQEDIRGDALAKWNTEAASQSNSDDKPEGHIELSEFDLKQEHSLNYPTETENQASHSPPNTTENNAYQIVIENGESDTKEKDFDGVSSIIEVSEADIRDMGNYTPELPKAKAMQESIYESPHSSRSDLSEVEYPRHTETSVTAAPGSSQETDITNKTDRPNWIGIETDANSSFESKEVPLVFGNRNETHDDSSGFGSTHRATPLGKNRVTPVDDHTIAKSKKQYYTLSREQQRMKNSVIIGADDNVGGIGCCGWLLYTFSILLIVITLPFSLIFCIKVVQEYERAVIFRLGRLPSGGAKGPGIFFIIPCIESYTKIDLRTVSFDVPPQEVLTKDSVTVSVDAVVYYRVSNPTVSVANVENAHHSTRLLAQTTLRNILGTKDMSEILSDRESISQGMQTTLDEATENWGIKVERVEIKDVRLPVQLQRAMAAEAEAAREARAKVIAAEGEQKASHALKDAADVMAKSSAALQLRYLQTLSSISAEKNSTIIFPLPIDLMKAFMEKKS